jgi:RNA polymerase sigma-70 factor (ECF subfamily)
MLRVKAGDLNAFDRLITRYKNSVVNTLYKITQKRDSAEDLSQEVFLRVFRAKKTYKAKAKFTTWLFRIVRNVAYNAIRDNNKHKDVSIFTNGYEKGHDEAGLKSEVPGPEEIANVSDLKRDLKKALESLSLNQRTAVVLSRIEGMAYIEIGQILNISESAVKMLISRAKKNLARALGHYIQEK